MASKKLQGPVTRSSFAVLEDDDGSEFPALLPGLAAKKSKKNAGAKVPAPIDLPVDTPAAGKTQAALNGTTLIMSGKAGQTGVIGVGMSSAADMPTAAAVNELTAGENSTAKAATYAPWNALFKDNRDPRCGIKLRYIPPKGDTLDFGDRVLPSMVEMWGFCLVGHFAGNFPGLKAVHDLKAKWGVKCLVRSHKKGWLIFKFQSEEERSKVLQGGPYTVFGKLLMLKVLSENFSFEDEEFLKVSIWVKFHDLPLQLWNDEAMSEVASMVGVPITTDKITQERINNDYARVLIEVDISKPPPLSFPIWLPSQKVIKQSVVYETFPSYCFLCKEFGHHPFICKKLSKCGVGANKEKEKLDVVGAEIVVTESVTDRPEVALEPSPTGSPPYPTGSQGKQVVEGGSPTGCSPNPTGSKKQTAAVSIGATPRVQGPSEVEQKVKKNSNEDHVANLEEIKRVVAKENDLHQQDVVIKCEVLNGKTFKLFVKPFRFVHASVIRVDTSLRLTDDLDKTGLTFTAKCLEAIPGVTKKKGEVCFDSKFTTPFRAFFGC
ncbi:unnamed protein product [Cuscuta europaea]|uniref:DUF4283 domain-containing protein n=1 Tax=Cuscuta europaea TaxID=41803 RepID=A0A9P0Z817_CUSEU|nr:unnamed protein product [Cuscuta europaea]